MSPEISIRNFVDSLTNAAVQQGRKKSFLGRVFKPVIRLVTNRRLTRYVLLTLNVLLLAAIGFFTLRGSESSVLLNQQAAGTADTNLASPLDQLSSAAIAVNAARATGLAETTAVTNQSDSVAAEMAVAAADTTVVAKPQTVATVTKTRKDIQAYTVAAGDTVASIAAKFGVTSDSVMWSNNLRSNTVPVGAALTIPPINGLVYTVRAGDTPDSLAQRYRASKEQIIAFNDTEISGLPVGEQIVIPGGQQPLPTIVSRAVFVGSAGYNGYDYGWCTWYAATRRAQLGRPVPGNLGNANTWASRAAAQGIPIGAIPQPGAVAMKKSRAPGHVGVVEVVYADGSFWMSEMNSSGQVSMTDSRPAGGWGRVDWKLIPASLASTYTYIY